MNINFGSAFLVTARPLSSEGTPSVASYQNAFRYADNSVRFYETERPDVFVIGTDGTREADQFVTGVLNRLSQRHPTSVLYHPEQHENNSDAQENHRKIVDRVNSGKFQLLNYLEQDLYAPL
ncbi:MAG: hypothetical protein VKJ04_07565 [Vampirovibrionales bacterium]|nr:hypothetical protein [Vampirovibrionales bacterium]